MSNDNWVCVSEECEYPDCSCPCDGRGPIRPVASLSITSHSGGISRTWLNGSWQELPDGIYFFSHIKPEQAAALPPVGAQEDGEKRMRTALYEVMGQQHVLKYCLGSIRRWHADPNFNPDLEIERAEKHITEWHRCLVVAVHGYPLDTTIEKALEMADAKGKS